MNSLKRFLLGFLLGVGIMYWYLHHSQGTWEQARQWFGDSAAKYRGDETHQRARQVLGEDK